MAAALLVGPALVQAQPDTRREVNITSDSAPGWSPTAELEAGVRQKAADYLSAMDQGRYADAYAYLSPSNRGESQAAFAQRLRAFNTLAGAVVERRIVKVTWTKNPAQAPAPGIYAAIDLVSRFLNVDRHCGYLVLYQPPAGGAFTVSREEDTFLDNATARTIAQQQSEAAVEETWARASAVCPNYPRKPAVAPAPLPEASDNTIGYPSVAAALADLRRRPGVVISTREGWTIAEDAAGQAFWSFPPSGHPAYPAAVKRQIVNQDGGAALKMSVLCEASKAACDDLVRTFEQLNARMKASLQAQGPSAKGP